MKKLILALIVAAMFAGCKKSEECPGGVCPIDHHQKDSAGK